MRLQFLEAPKEKLRLDLGHDLGSVHQGKGGEEKPDRKSRRLISGKVCKGSNCAICKLQTAMCNVLSVHRKQLCNCLMKHRLAKIQGCPGDVDSGTVRHMFRVNYLS